MGNLIPAFEEPGSESAAKLEGTIRCSEGGSGMAQSCFGAIRYAMGMDKDKAMDDKTIHPQMRARYFQHACPQLLAP